MPVRRGANYYTLARGELTIGFPEDRITCANCPLHKYESAFKLYSCCATGEILFYPGKAIGKKCPLKSFEEMKEGGQKDELKGE